MSIAASVQLAGSCPTCLHTLLSLLTMEQPTTGSTLLTTVGALNVYVQNTRLVCDGMRLICLLILHWRKYLSRFII